MSHHQLAPYKNKDINTNLVNHIQSATTISIPFVFNPPPLDAGEAKLVPPNPKMLLRAPPPDDWLVDLF